MRVIAVLAAMCLYVAGCTGSATARRASHPPELPESTIPVASVEADNAEVGKINAQKGETNTQVEKNLDIRTEGEGVTTWILAVGLVSLLFVVLVFVTIRSVRSARSGR